MGIVLWSMVVVVQAQTTYFRVIGGIPHLPVLASTAVVSSPSSGMVVFSTTDNKPMLYTGSAWIDLCKVSTFTSNSGYFKVVGGIPIFPVKDASTSTDQGAMHINTSFSLEVYTWGAWFPVKSFTTEGGMAAYQTTIGSVYGTELLAPVLNSAPTPTGLAAGAFYVNANNMVITWYDGTTWVGLSCCYAYTNAEHTERLVFQCHNLGANSSLNPYVYVSNGDAVDHDIKGSLYQWGRPSDGHQLRSSNTFVNGTTILKRPDNGNFIIPDYTTSYDWYFLTPDNTLWNAIKADNDPCPEGYRVPTISEWNSIFKGTITAQSLMIGNAETATSNTWTWTGNGFMVGTALYLPCAGDRFFVDGSISGVGNFGEYWSSSTPEHGSMSNAIEIWPYTVDPTREFYRSDGLSVRCVAE